METWPGTLSGGGARAGPCAGRGRDASRGAPAIRALVSRAPDDVRYRCGKTMRSLASSATSRTILPEEKVRPGQRVLIHGAAGGVGSALLQLGRLVGLEMYGTCSSRGAQAVSDLGGIPIDYRLRDFVEEIQRLTGEGVDVVFDPIGGPHLWHSRKALRPGGRVVGYGLSTSLRGEGLTSSRPGRRQRFRGTAVFALYIAGGWLLPGRKRVIPYSVQTLKRLKPAWFRQDLIALFDLLQHKKIKPLIAERFPLAEARHAQQLLAKGGVIGKIVLVRNGSSRESAAA